MTVRTTFLIDGFNVYHSAVDIEQRLSLKVKWLDYASLCKSYLHHFGRDAQIESIYYFTALAYHLNKPDVVERHKAYIRCLRETGVKDVLGRFKARTNIKCPRCGTSILGHEEKETDVAISSKLLEVLYNDECDCIVLVTGDTDLSPAVRTAQHLFPDKRIVFAFPYRRKSEELAHLAPGSFRMRPDNYVKHQLPDPFVLPDGTRIAKPAGW